MFIIEKELEKRFISCLSAGGVTPAKAKVLFDNVNARYGEDHRAYHTLSHVAAMLSHFDTVKHLLDDPVSVELAIWYHDVVYHTQKTCPDRSFYNEKESVDLVKDHLKGAAFDLSVIEGLILSTIPGSKALSNDQAYLQDIDLSIFGQSPKVYQAYVSNVHKEYDFVPRHIRVRSRLPILEAFYKKETIYNTLFFQDKWEEQARANLLSEIQTLRREARNQKRQKPRY